MQRLLETIRAAAFLAAGLYAGSAGAAVRNSADATASPLEVALKPAYEVSLGVIGAADLGDAGSSAIAEIVADWQLAYFSNVLGSDTDLNLVSDWMFFVDDTEAGLPDQLASIGLDVGATWQYVNKSALEVRVEPELNWDLESLTLDAFYTPFSIVYTKELDPNVAGEIGAAIRPDYERVIMPVAGLHLRVAQKVFVLLGVPESRVTMFVSPAITPYAAWQWTSVTYQMEDRADVDKPEISVEDFRLYGGLRYRVSEELQLAGEVGSVFGREYDFDPPRPDSPRKVEADGAMFVRIALLGPF